MSTILVFAQKVPLSSPIDLSPLRALALGLLSLLILVGAVIGLWQGIKKGKPATLLAMVAVVFLAGYMAHLAMDVTQLRDSDSFTVVDQMTGIEAPTTTIR